MVKITRSTKSSSIVKEPIAEQNTNMYRWIWMNAVKTKAIQIAASKLHTTSAETATLNPDSEDPTQRDSAVTLN